MNTTILKVVLFVNSVLFMFLYAMYNEMGRKTFFGARFPNSLLKALGFNISLDDFMKGLNENRTLTTESAKLVQTTVNYKNLIFEE